MQMKERLKETEIRSKIIRATLDLAREKGWDEVSTRKISARINYSTTAIYHYFGSKESLLQEVKQEGFKQMREQFERITDRIKEPTQQLLSISLFHFDFAVKNREQYQIMFNLEGIKCEGSGHHKDQIKAGDIVRNVLRELSPEPPTELFFNWWALIQGFIVVQFNSDMKTRPDDMKERISNAIRRFAKSIKEEERLF